MLQIALLKLSDEVLMPKASVVLRFDLGLTLFMWSACLKKLDEQQNTEICQFNGSFSCHRSSDPLNTPPCFNSVRLAVAYVNPSGMIPPPPQWLLARKWQIVMCLWNSKSRGKKSMPTRTGAQGEKSEKARLIVGLGKKRALEGGESLRKRKDMVERGRDVLFVKHAPHSAWRDVKSTERIRYELRGHCEVNTWQAIHHNKNPAQARCEGKTVLQRTGECVGGIGSYSKSMRQDWTIFKSSPFWVQLQQKWKMS